MCLNKLYVFQGEEEEKTAGMEPSRLLHGMEVDRERVD